MAATTLTLSRLREMLRYDPTTGHFTRLVTTGRCNRYQAGTRAGGKDVHGYATVSLDGAQYKAHRLAWFYVHGVWPALAIDHINADRFDNRLKNLRLATSALNSQNRRTATRASLSGLLGAYPNKKNWMAQIHAGGKRIHIGTFPTPEEAHAAYVDAKRRLHEGCTI